MTARTSIASVLLLVGLTALQNSFAQTRTDLDKVYADESHCLTGPEIRGDKDNPISCYCRDAIVDARYVYQTYGFSMDTMDFKDPNLKGTWLTLEMHANETCKDKENVLGANTEWIHKAIEEQNWTWRGPEVTRKYPSDAEIERIKPDAHNMRSVPFTVTLTYRDIKGRVLKTESFAAHELEHKNATTRRSHL